MEYTQAEILQTVAMTEMEHLDVRTVTLGLSLLDCASDSIAGVAQKAGDKIRNLAAKLVPTVDQIGEEFGIRVANKRISITPVSSRTHRPVACSITRSPSSREKPRAPTCARGSSASTENYSSTRPAPTSRSAYG